LEFFRIVNRSITEEQLKEKLALESLEDFSNHMFPIGEPIDGKLEIGGLWGEFTLCRNEIKGGLRFHLEECPNALAWTVTTGYPPAREAIVLHLTINRQRKQQEFVDEIDEFLDDHASCLEIFLGGKD
jgi:hypothetical protein